MKSLAITPDQYVAELPVDRQKAIKELRNVILKNLPKGFSEGMGYGMIGYSVPHSIYPAGYHCNKEQPLPFASIASQKNFIAFHHLGIYAMPDLLKWFADEYPKHISKKPDLGKGCIRFKKIDDIPFKLIGELMKKISVKEWIEVYEKTFRK